MFPLNVSGCKQRRLRLLEVITELEFEQTANLRAKAGHDRSLHNASVDAEPIPELEFDHTLGW